MIFRGGSRPPFHAKLQFRSVLSGAHPLSSTHRAWGIIQDQDGDADCTFIQRRQVPTFKGVNVHPLIDAMLDAIFFYLGDKQTLP